MLIGQTIVGARGSTTTVYTPFFPRQGEVLVSATEVIEISATTQILITVEVKNSEDTTVGNPTNGSTKTVNADGVESWDSDGNMRQLVRYKIELSSTSGTTGDPIFCHFRMLAPSWPFTGAQSV